MNKKSKKVPFLSYEEDLEHHKQFVAHFAKRIEPILTQSKQNIFVDEQIKTFQKMYEWILLHLVKFEDNAYELTVEILRDYIQAEKEITANNDIQVEFTGLLFLQTFVKLHSLYQIKSKHDNLYNVLTFMLSKKLVLYYIKAKDELIFGVLALIICQDLIRKTNFFFPETIICLERALTFLINEIEEKQINIKSEDFDVNQKSIQRSEFLNICKQVFKYKENFQDVDSFYVTLYKVLDKLLGSYLILYGSDPNCDVTLGNLSHIIRRIKNPVLLAYSSGTFNKLKNLIESCKQKANMDIIPDKPLIRIKQLTPKFDDSENENDNYEEELRKEKKTLKKAVSRESRRAMRELAYDSMVLQNQKDSDKKQQDDRKKSSFKKFVKFMEEQDLEGKRIKSTQLQHQTRYKVKKRRLAGSQTDPGSMSTNN